MDPEQGGDDRRGVQVPERFRYERMGSAYQGAMESVLSIVIGVLLGWWVDSAFETGPWGVLAGATIGFGAFVVRLSRLRPGSEDPVEDVESPSSGPEDTRRARVDVADEGVDTENHDRPR
jgi:F0F1-type ATP synthase assembly protein I